MRKAGKDPLPEEVGHLAGWMQEWRQSKRGKVPIPCEIWDAAARLAEQFGVCRIARAIGLDYTGLRIKVVSARKAASAFMELPAGMMLADLPAREPRRGPDAGPVIEISMPDGARMRICLEAGRASDATGIVAAFLGRGC